MNILKAEPLTVDNFKPYGDVIDISSASQKFEINYGRTIRYHDLADIDTNHEGGKPIVSIFHSQPMPDNFKVSVMERHPLSSQTFYPLENSNYIVIVAERGEFDAQSLKAFIASPKQGVNYARGTWHHYCQSITADCMFLVIDRKGQGNNCDEVFLEQPMEIVVSN